MNNLALAGGTIVTPSGVHPEWVIATGGARIAYVGPRSHAPPAGETIDCSGATILPGFWNSHVHFFERKWSDAASSPAGELQEQLLDFSRFGFTSVFDLSSDLDNTNALRARVASDELHGPRIRTTGPGLVPPGALPPDIVNRIMGLMPVEMPMVSARATVDRAVDANVARGADAIKVFASGQAPESVMPPEIMQRAVERAHAHAKPVFVHVNTAADVSTALACGADVIAHTTPRSPWPGSLFERELGDRALTPTLKLWNDVLRHDRLHAQRSSNEQAALQLRAWRSAGGCVLFGTDYGAVNADPSAEYALMQNAGMLAGDVIASLTSAPACRFAAGENTGVLQEGFAADIAVVDGDPQHDIRALANVRYTIRGGRIVYART